MSLVCPGCGAQSEEHVHLCHPSPHVELCRLCGKKAPAGHLCQDRLRDVKFVCIHCGRLSVEAGLLCSPLELFGRGRAGKSGSNS